VGLAVLGSTLGLALWNIGRRQDYMTDYEVFAGGAVEDREQRYLDLLGRHDSIEQVDRVSWGLMGLGVASLAVALGLFFGAPSLDRGRRALLLPSPGGLTLAFEVGDGSP
jgi:hypothetical protein